MKFIVIDGNIGCGKTTLLNQLKNKLDAFIVLESVEEWKKDGILDKYYQNPKEMAFIFQMKVAISHLKNIKNLIEKHGQNITIISERSTYSCFNIFTKMLEKVEFMNEDEVRIHRELCLDCGIKPDIYLYLKTDVDVALERIKKRNRETNISRDYLEDLNNQYENLREICEEDGIRFFEIDANVVKEEVLEKSLNTIVNFYNN